MENKTIEFAFDFDHEIVVPYKLSELPPTIFDDLPVYTSDKGIDKATDLDFIKKWIFPFAQGEKYPVRRDERLEFKKIKWDITPEVCYRLLGDKRYRSKSAGAQLVAYKKYHEFTDIIGTLLLKNQASINNWTYALALVRLNTEKAIDYLHRFLDYYMLWHPDGYTPYSAIAAILYLDRINKTQHFNRHEANWQKLVQYKKDDLQQSTDKELKRLADAKSPKSEIEKTLNFARMLLSDLDEKPDTKIYERDMRLFKEIDEYNGCIHNVAIPFIEYCVDHSDYKIKITSFFFNEICTEFYRKVSVPMVRKEYW